MKIVKELPVNDRVAVYNRVLELRDQGWSLTATARDLNLNLSTVSRWRNGLKSPLGKLHYASLEPSPELAWLVGLLIGDGTIRIKKHRDGNYYAVQLQMANKNRDLVEQSADIIEKIFGKKPAIYSFRHPLSEEKPCGWDLCHKQFNEYLAPIWKDNFTGVKSLTDAYPTDFLRGLYDAEGWVTFTPRPTRLYCRIGLTNSAVPLLNIVEAILFELGFKPKLFRKSLKPRRLRNHTIYSTKQCYDLCLSKQDDILNFRDKIHFFSGYRRARLEALCQLIEQRKSQS